MLLEGHTDIIMSMVFSRKFNWLISGGNKNDKSIILWK